MGKLPSPMRAHASMPASSLHLRLCSAASLLLPFLVAPACSVAGERVVVGPYGARLVHVRGLDGGYGFADAGVSGAYVGAPFTRFPRPRDLVPPAQGSGTFGIPTIAGIREASASQPVVYAIAGGPRRAASRARVLSREDSGWLPDDAGASAGPGGAVRVVSVDVPRR